MARVTEIEVGDIWRNVKATSAARTSPHGHFKGHLLPAQLARFRSALHPERPYPCRAAALLRRHPGIGPGPGGSPPPRWLRPCNSYVQLLIVRALRPTRLKFLRTGD